MAGSHLSNLTSLAVEPKTGLAGRLAWLAQPWLVALPVSLLFSLAMMFNYIFPLNATLHHRDYVLQLWNLWEVNEALVHGHNPYLTDLQYFPVGAHLGRHVLSPGFFPLTFAVWLFTGDDPFYPLYTYKLIIWLAYALLLYFSYLTLREFGWSRWACFIPAVAYTFSDFYLFHIHRLHIISGFFVPLIALTAIRLYQKPTLLNALLWAAVSGLGLYFTELTLFSYMALAFCGLIILFFMREERLNLLKKVRRLGAKAIIRSGVLFLFIVSVFSYHWLASDALPPDPDEAFKYSANLIGFFTPTEATTPFYGTLFEPINAQITTGMAGFEIFIGFPLLLSGLLGILVARQKWVRVALGLSLIFFVLSLGPTLKILNVDTGLPLPYDLLHSAPPFNIGRTPVRFVALAFFFWMMVAAGGLHWLRDKLTVRFGPRVALVGLLLILAWTIAEVYNPVERRPPLVLPPPIAQVKDGPVINLPLKYHDPWALLPQIFYNQPTATGYVSRNSAAQAQHFRTLQLLYAEAVAKGSCRRFEEMGFRNIILWPGVADDVARGLSDPARCGLNVVDFRPYY